MRGTAKSPRPLRGNHEPFFTNIVALEDTIRDLRNFIEDRFQVPNNDPDFTEDVHLFNYGYIDSFGAVELTSFVQHKFDVLVKDTDLIAYPMNTIREIATFVAKRKAGEQ